MTLWPVLELVWIIEDTFFAVKLIIICSYSAVYDRFLLRFFAKPFELMVFHLEWKINISDHHNHVLYSSDSTENASKVSLRLLSALLMRQLRCSGATKNRRRV